MQPLRSPLLKRPRIVKPLSRPALSGAWFCSRNFLHFAALLGLIAPLAGQAQFGAPLTAFTNCPPGVSGHSAVAVAALGSDRVLIGGTEFPSGTNAVFLFGTNGALLAACAAPPAAYGQEGFGSALAALGTDRVLVGASVWAPDPMNPPQPGDWRPGAAYLFNTNGALLATLAHPNPTPGNWDQFGIAVAAVGNDRVLIGAPNWDIWMPGHGAAYLLSASGGLLATFTSPSPATGDGFGHSLTTVGNDRVLIGAPGTGTAYLFNTNGTLLTTFSNPHPAPANVTQFGRAVAAVGGDRVLIGAPSYDPSRRGAAYLFNTNGTLLTTFTNASHPVTAIGDDFGCALTAVDAGRVLIGAPWSGVASLFSTDGTLLFTFTDPWTSYRQRFGSLLAAVGPERVALGSEYGGPVYLFRAPAQVHWLGGAGNWSDAAKWSPHPPASGDVVVLPTGATVNVDLAGAQVGALTVPAGSTVNVQSGAALAVFGPLLNNGTMNLAGDVTSYAPGDAVVQNGTLTIDRGVAMKGMDSGGSDFAFVQLGGATGVNGALDFHSGHIRVQGGTLNINEDAAMRGCDAGGKDLAFIQTGGSVTIDGTFETWNPSVQAGSLTVGAGGMLDFSNSVMQVQGGTLNVNRDAAMRGFDGGGSDLAFIQTGGSVTIDGTFETTNAGLQGGGMNGGGTIAGNFINSGGTLSPGASPGTFTVTGNYVQTNTGTLRIEIAGRLPGQADQLRVGGTAVLGGRLDVGLLDSFAPDIGEQFSFMVCTNVSGTFTNVVAPPGISITNSSAGPTPVVTGIVPTTILGPGFSGGNTVFTFGTVSNRSYTVEWSSSLAPANWQFYTNLSGTGEKVSCAVPMTNAPPRRFFRVVQP